jgi:hypothetical protein
MYQCGNERSFAKTLRFQPRRSASNPDQELDQLFPELTAVIIRRAEAAKLKKMLAEQMLDVAILKEMLGMEAGERHA